MIIEGRLLGVEQLAGNTKRGILFVWVLEDRKLRRKRRKSGRFKELGDDPAELHNQEYFKVTVMRNEELTKLMGKKLRITIEEMNE